jgi:hypothetical protein
MGFSPDVLEAAVGDDGRCVVVKSDWEFAMMKDLICVVLSEHRELPGRAA